MKTITLTDEQVALALNIINNRLEVVGRSLAYEPPSSRTPPSDEWRTRVTAHQTDLVALREVLT